MFWAKNIQIWARIGGLGALQSGAKSSKSCFFHRFRLIKTSTGLQIAPKSLSQVGTVPTDLPAKEFLKKTDPSPSYGPKRDGGSRRDSRRPSRFLTNFTKTTMARSTVQISAQFKKGVNHLIIINYNWPVQTFSTTFCNFFLCLGWHLNFCIIASLLHRSCDQCVHCAQFADWFKISKDFFLCTKMRVDGFLVERALFMLCHFFCQYMKCMCSKIKALVPEQSRTVLLCLSAP